MRIAVTERCIFGHCTMLKCMQCGAGADELFSAQQNCSRLSRARFALPKYGLAVTRNRFDFDVASSWNVQPRVELPPVFDDVRPIHILHAAMSSDAPHY